MSSAGLANVVAALFGISISFIGSRYFVFRQTDEGVLPQAAKFGGLYFAFALVHGAVLFIWTDLLGYDYRLGFLLATAFQIAGSYLGNKFLVFKNDQ
jgi:putative flippase GtrA